MNFFQRTLSEGGSVHQQKASAGKKKWTPHIVQKKSRLQLPMPKSGRKIKLAKADPNVKRGIMNIQ
jgi:hypothetical protein